VLIPKPNNYIILKKSVMALREEEEKEKKWRQKKEKREMKIGTASRHYI
jgi:hypothetical protein